MKDDKKKNLMLSACMLFVGIILFLISGEKASVITETSLERNHPGKGKKDYEFEAVVEDVLVDGIEVSVDERDYTFEECESLFAKCKENLVKTVLSGNEDLGKVTDDLNFVTELKGYPFSFEYDTDAPDKIETSGAIATDKPFSSVIRITATYGSFSDSYAVKVIVNPSDDVKKRVYRRKILSVLNEYDSEEALIGLPTELDGAKVSYNTAGKKREPAFLLLGAVAAAAVLLGAARDEKIKRDAYKKAILKEYPTVLRKISLYLASGMNLRNIWQAIYEEGSKKKGKDNPFYKEMGVSINELSGGISEGLVYTRFGERTKEPELIRFTALLSQNLKKGSSKLKELLNEEVSKAFMAKKQRAIKEGEEAGTKMLIPMIMLLIDVMIIIVIPAFRGI